MWKSCKLKCKIIDCFHLKIIFVIYFCKCQRADEKKSKEAKQTLEELNSAHRLSTNQIHERNCSGFCHIPVITIAFTELSLYGRILTSVVCTDLTAFMVFGFSFMVFSGFCHIPVITISFTKLSRSVWENLDLGCVYRPHCFWSVLTTSVKILP